jgi:hypothetical protein
MALPKLTGVQSRISTDGTQIQLAFVFEDGKNIQAQTNPRDLAELIGGLLETCASAPMRQLTNEVPVTEQPIKVSAIGISPLPGSSNDAVLALAIGTLSLQFCIPVDHLHVALRKLEDETELDPNNSRPH